MDEKGQSQDLLVGTSVGLAENLQQEEKEKVQWRGSCKEPRKASCLAQGRPELRSFAEDSTVWRWNVRQKEIFI